MRALALPSSKSLRDAVPFVVLFVAAFAALAWPTFLWMAERFDTHDSFYSHGWLVPFASGWLVWQRRETLQSISHRGTFKGLRLLLPALAVYLLATWWRIGFLAGFALLGVVYGLVWTCWGSAVFWALRFPLFFLIFMVPLPGVLLITISFKMKLMAATLATKFLGLIGIPAMQAGSTIRLRNVSVIVDDTCSGLRSLISLIALGTLWMALMPPTSTRGQKLLVVASSIPIALIANMVRILFMVLMSAIYGAQIADSFIHYGSGIVLFGVAVCALAGFSRIVQEWPGSLATNR